jgi:hypothetical protein
MSNILVNTIKDTGNNTLLSSDGSGSVTLGSGFPTNTPSFLAYQSSNQTVGSGTATKIQFDTKSFDTNSCYDNTTNYRFTPTVAGYYWLFVSIQINSADDFDNIQTLIYKNGSELAHANDRTEFYYVGKNFYLSYANGSTDYFEGYWRQDSGTNKETNNGAVRTYFGGYKLIGA